MVEKRFKVKEEEFWRRMILPVEECLRYGLTKPSGAYRWFKSPNVVAIEHYRAAKPKSAPRLKASLYIDHTKK